jgi:uncharacterized protein YgfB (UPF0149 family)
MIKIALIMTTLGQCLTMLFHSPAIFASIISFTLAAIMNQKSMPDFQALNHALSDTTLKLHPSEAHGLISGVLSGDVSGKTPWQTIVTGDEDPAKTRELLQTLFEASAAQLDEFLFEFQLILPPDSDELALRAEALTLWCQGYLTGLKLTKVQIVGRSPSDVTEAINDMIEIAKMNYEDVVATEEDEAAYVELVEYVRVAAILIYQEMHEQNAESRNASKHLH